jgi:hypothetical protein
LKEFDICQVLDNIEFSWVYATDGLIDLDYHINYPHSRTGASINAIYRYRQLCERRAKSLNKIGVSSDVFLESMNNFLDSIVTVSWSWRGPELGRKSSLNQIFRKLVARTIVRKWEIKNGLQWEGFPYSEVFFSVKPKGFDDYAKKHVMEVFKATGADLSRPIALDQPFPGNNPQACFKFFDDPYAIVVDRDPRDNYTFARTKMKYAHIYHIMPSNDVKDFVKYYRALRDKQPYKEQNERILRIHFEDMVYHYDETTKIIRDFLGLGENPHPKTIFDPQISMPNTQVWKRFPQFADDIAYIEKELPEYLFDYTNCPEPDCNGVMFYGKSPKNSANKKPVFG